MKSLWLYLHFPHLQLDALYSAEQESAPIVILHGKSNIVLQHNKAAADSGITFGMGLGTAAALDHRLQVLPYQYDIEHKKLQEIAEHLYLVTSDICLFPPDGLLLRIHNMLTLYGGLTPYWQTLSSQLAHFNVSYHFATGQSPYAARLLARTQWDRISEDMKLLKQQISQRDLRHTELPSKTITALNRVGIHTVAALLALSLKEVAKRFDIDLVTYLGRLTGEFHHPVSFFHPQTHFERYMELLYEISHTDSLQRPLEHLLKSLEHFLKLRDLLTQRIILRFHQRDHSPLNVEVGSAQGEYQAKKWLELSALTLESLKLQAPVYGITLTTGSTHIRTPEKTDLFAGNRGALSYLQLISLLQAKLGEAAIRQIGLFDDFRPEQANCYCAASGETPMQLSQRHTTRPSFLLATPQRLTEQVSVISGPERISTGWWDNKPVVRDYYIGRTRHGKWLWLFKTPQAHWFVHGIFS